MTAQFRKIQRYYYRRLFSNALGLMLGDALVLTAALLLSSIIRVWLKDGLLWPARGFLIIPVWWIGAATFRLVPGWGLGPVEELRRTQILLLAVFGMATAAMFLSQSATITSRLRFIIMYAISAAGIPLVRIWIKRFFLRRDRWGCNTAIYGTDETIDHVLSVIQEEAGLGYMPYAVFDDQLPVGSDLHGVKVRGGLNDYTTRAPFAILGAPSIQRDKLARLLDGPLRHYRRVILIPDLLDIPSLWVSPRDFMGVLGLEVVRNLLNPLARIVKRGTEYAAVIITLPVWLPVIGVVAALVWLQDRHSPFYMQERVGPGRRTFKAIKFRTMVPDAEARLAEELERNPEAEEEWRTHYKLKNDPRVTPLGRLLRRTSMDELPQLINVLKGQMALVGPRPLPRYHYNELPEYVLALRDKVLPGMTGMWQVSCRSQSGVDGMIRWDSYYVRNWSVWLDIVIIVRTLRAVVQRHGAY